VTIFNTLQSSGMLQKPLPCEISLECYQGENIVYKL